MVFLAITPAGLAGALALAQAGDAVWCGSGAITEADFATCKHANLSRFIHRLEDLREVEDAVDTLKEHHPGQVVWIEAAGPA